ncbi:MAG: hypothetical protein ACKOA0_14350, partial [Burkholderiaceae bacterium]
MGIKPYPEGWCDNGDDLMSAYMEECVVGGMAKVVGHQCLDPNPWVIALPLRPVVNIGVLGDVQLGGNRSGGGPNEVPHVAFVVG